MSTTVPSHFPWPPVLYLMSLLIGIALSIVYPLPWLPSPGADLLFAAGCLCVVGAVALYYTSAMALRRANTTIMPTRATDHLVTIGPYSFTRNPIYLGNTMLVLGIGLITGNAWLLPLAFIAAFATARLAIQGEERHLDGRFGKRYRDYAKRVRRWI